MYSDVGCAADDGLCHIRAARKSETGRDDLLVGLLDLKDRRKQLVLQQYTPESFDDWLGYFALDGQGKCLQWIIDPGLPFPGRPRDKLRNVHRVLGVDRTGLDRQSARCSSCPGNDRAVDPGDAGGFRVAHADIDTLGFAERARLDTAANLHGKLVCVGGNHLHLSRDDRGPFLDQRLRIRVGNAHGNLDGRGRGRTLDLLDDPGRRILHAVWL